MLELHKKMLEKLIIQRACIYFSVSSTDAAAFERAEEKNY
jgi:hypothetical protein